MSFDAIAWVVHQEVRPSSLKFVLFCFAKCAHDETGLCFPSVAYVQQFTSQDRKTVLANIGRLIELGFIADTGKRAGKTRGVVVYKFNGPVFGTVKANSTETGTAPNSGPLSGPVFPAKQSRFSVEAVPKTGHGKKGKERESKEQEIGARAARTPPRKRAPADFLVTDEMRTWAASRTPGVDIERETEAFRDHEYRNGKTDWPAAWRSWMRKARSVVKAPAEAAGWKPPPDEPGFHIPEG